MFLLKTGELIPIYHNCEQPQVSSASVNLTTETAIVWPVSEVKVVPNWQKDVGEVLAKHLTSCGFKSNLRGLHLVSIIYDYIFHLFCYFFCCVQSCKFYLFIFSLTNFH